MIATVILSAMLAVGPIAAASEAPLALPVDGGRLRGDQQAIYDAEHLEIRKLTTQFTTSTWGPYWHWGPFGGWGSYQMSYWSVAQGGRLLDAPGYLRVVGREDEAADLQRRIRRHRTTAIALWSAAIGGVVGALVGDTMMSTARTEQEYYNGVGVAVTGSLTAVVGGLTAGVPSARARDLRYQIGLSVPYDEVARSVSLHNEALRRSLMWERGRTDPPEPSLSR